MGCIYIFICIFRFRTHCHYHGPVSSSFGQSSMFFTVSFLCLTARSIAMKPKTMALKVRINSPVFFSPFQSSVIFQPGILLHYSPNLNISQPPEPPARSPAPFHKPARRQRNVPKSRSFGPRRYFGLDKISKHFEPCPVNNMVGCKSNGYAMLCLVLLVLSCFYKHQHGVVEAVIVSYNI